MVHAQRRRVRDADELHQKKNKTPELGQVVSAQNSLPYCKFEVKLQYSSSTLLSLHNLLHLARDSPRKWRLLCVNLATLCGETAAFHPKGMWTQGLEGEPTPGFAPATSDQKPRVSVKELLSSSSLVVSHVIKKSTQKCSAPFFVLCHLALRHGGATCGRGRTCLAGKAMGEIGDYSAPAAGYLSGRQGCSNTYTGIFRSRLVTSRSAWDTTRPVCSDAWIFLRGAPMSPTSASRARLFRFGEPLGSCCRWRVPHLARWEICSPIVNTPPPLHVNPNAITPTTSTF